MFGEIVCYNPETDTLGILVDCVWGYEIEINHSYQEGTRFSPSANCSSRILLCSLSGWIKIGEL